MPFGFLEAVQKLPLFLIGLKNPQFAHLRGLSILQKTKKPAFINRILLIVIGVTPFLVTVMLHKSVYNEGLKAVFFVSVNSATLTHPLLFSLPSFRPLLWFADRLLQREKDSAPKNAGIPDLLFPSPAYGSPCPHRPAAVLR